MKFLKAVTEEFGKKTTLPWVQNPKWLSTEIEEVTNAHDQPYTYFQLERTKTPALDMKGNSMSLNVKCSGGLREVLIQRAGHCATCHSTTHSKHGCQWEKYAKRLEISFWYKDK